MAQHKPVTHPVHAAHPPRINGKVGPGEPGFALGLAGFISSFVVGLVGLVLSAVALSQSKRVGKANTFALVGLIIGIIQTALGVLGLIVGTIAVLWLVGYCGEHPDQCQKDYHYNYGTDGTSDQTY